MSLTTKEFCIWLKGALDASGTAPNDEMLGRMLKMVSIDKGMYGARDDSDADKFVKELLTATQPVFGEPVSLSPKRVEGMVLALDKVLTGWPATTLAKTWKDAQIQSAIDAQTRLNHNLGQAQPSITVQDLYH